MLQLVRSSEQEIAQRRASTVDHSAALPAARKAVSKPSPLRGTEGSNPPRSGGESIANLTWSIRANAVEPGGSRLPLRATHPKSRSGRHGTSCRFSDSRAAEFVPAPIKPIRRLTVRAHQVHRRNVPPCRFVILLPATGSLADNTILLPFTSHGALLLSPAALRAER